MIRALWPMLAVLLALAPGCAGSYYKQYRAAHPDWYGEFPDPENDLGATLAVLHGPRTGDFTRTVSNLGIVRLGGEAPEEIDFADIRSGTVVPSDDQDYGVVAIVRCSSSYDLKMYQGEKRVWYLLPANRLRGYDHAVFHDRCVVSNEFRPASRERAGLELELLHYADEHLPPSMVHVAETYRKGLEYVRVGRIDDAEAMLAAGDAGFDVADKGAVKFERSQEKRRVARDPERASSRDQLVSAIRAAKSGDSP